MKYSSENHNWDLTIMASSKLVTIGKKLEKQYSFSALTGAMLLAVTGLQNFLNSIGYTISTNDEIFSFIDFEQMKIEEKLDFILEKFSITLNKGERPYQTVRIAVRWRNSVAHSKPTYVDETEINSVGDIKKLPQKHVTSNYNKFPPYENSVNKKMQIDLIEILLN